MIIIQLDSEQLKTLIQQSCESAISKLFATQFQSTTLQSEFIFLSEVCQLTNLKKATIYTLVSKKAIPTAKQTGQKKLVFNRAEIMAWIRNGMTKNKKGVNHAE